ncbi:hypothetical protein MHYP_G00317210 [Metynnis hypsauchen]
MSLRGFTSTPLLSRAAGSAPLGEKRATATDGTAMGEHSEEEQPVGGTASKSPLAPLQRLNPAPGSLAEEHLQTAIPLQWDVITPSLHVLLIYPATLGARQPLGKLSCCCR